MSAIDLFEIERSLWRNDPETNCDALRENAVLHFRETRLIAGPPGWRLVFHQQTDAEPPGSGRPS